MNGTLAPSSGRILYRTQHTGILDVATMSDAHKRLLMRTDWGIVHQNPLDGLRMGVSAGANVGERLMAVGARHYGDIRSQAMGWLNRVEIEVDRIDDLPGVFSGGMQQRLQIARNLVTKPRLVFMDEPTGGLDVSVQARLLDLLRALVQELRLAAIIVTHDLAVARVLADRLFVMKRGEIVENGLPDQVLDDPQHPYTQLLVSSILQVQAVDPGDDAGSKSQQILHPPWAGGCRAACAQQYQSRYHGRRMCRAAGSVRFRKEHAPEVDVCELQAAEREHRGPSPRPLGGHCVSGTAHRARCAQAHARLRQPVLARDPARILP